MFFSKILKAIPFLLQVILVVAAVVVFAWFDPFGILVPTKMKLKNTPVDVQSIRNMGQLITAEYYGEVVRSYAHKAVEAGEDQLESMKESIGNINDQFLLVTSEIKSDLDKKEIRKRDVFDQYKTLMGDWRDDPYYGQYMYFLFVTKVKDNKYKKGDLDNTLSGNREKLIVNRVVEGRMDMPKDGAFLDPLYTTFDENLKKDQKKQFKNSNLVMLGRGWVKAGFDFGTFNERNFRYDKEHKSIYLIGLKPQILSATINPWFIPEKGVEGFEFLVVQRKVRRDYNAVKAVKQMCLDELKRKAMEHDILQLATENARANLKEFFSLLLPDPIEHITFYENELQYSRDEIVKNDSISGEELLLIEHLLEKKKYLGIDSANTLEMNDQRMAFEDSLKHTPVYLFGKKVADGWSPQWAMAYEVSSDGVYDQTVDGAVIKKYTKQYCADTTMQWAPLCSGQALQFIKDHVSVFVWRDSTQWTPGVAQKLAGQLTSEDSLWIQPTNAPRKLAGLRIGLDDQKQPLDSLVIQHEGEICGCN